MLRIGRLRVTVALALSFACLLAGVQMAAGPEQTPPPAQAPAPQQQPVFRGGTSLVTVDVYPQRDGRIVPDLSADDFQVFEDGKPQKVETFGFVRIEPSPGAVEAPRADPNTVRESLALAADPRNRVFVLYLDIYHVTVAGSHDIRRPLVDMLDRLMAPDDLFGVMTPYLRPRDLSLGRKTLGIEDQLTRNWPWGQRDSILRDPADSEVEQCFATDPQTHRQWIVNDGGAQRLLVDMLVDRRREDATLAHLESLVSYLGAIREARKAVMLLSPGWVLYHRDEAILGQITGQLRRAGGVSSPSAALGALMTKTGPTERCDQLATRLLTLDDQQRMRDLMTDANRNNVTFYPVSPGGLQAIDTPISQLVGANPNAQPGISDSILSQEFTLSRARSSSARTLAENTDGIAVVDTNDLAGGLQRIIDDASAYYLLGYYSTNAKVDNKFRRIEVKVAGSGIKVKARRGYVASALPVAVETGTGGAATAEPTPVATALAELARLDRPSELFTYGAVSGGDVAVVAEIASAQLSGGTWAQGADVQAIVTGPGGETRPPVSGRIEPGQRSAIVRVSTDGATGPWQVLVKVDGAGGALTSRFDVPAAAGALLGRPIVFRGTPSARSALRPVADQQFRRSERVHLEWPVIAPLDARTARLLDRRGQPLPLDVTVSERDAGSGPLLVADLNLAPLGPGDYLIEITAGRGADTERQVIAIRIVP